MTPFRPIPMHTFYNPYTGEVICNTSYTYGRRVCRMAAWYSHEEGYFRYCGYHAQPRFVDFPAYGRRRVDYLRGYVR